MTGEKQFQNNTGMTLRVILTVRQGDDPNQNLKDVNFSLEPNASQRIKYGNSQNPFLNVMEISAIQPGTGGIMSSRVVLRRGDVVDNQFNMHDTVVFAWDGTNVMLSFTNTWTVR